jgi:hypothetical protein
MGAGFDLRRSGKNVSIDSAVDMLTPHANFNDLGFMRSTTSSTATPASASTTPSRSAACASSSAASPPASP